MSFELAITTGWADMDMNAHMRNTAYLDHAVDVRLKWFAHCGFNPGEFARRRIGPVIMSDEVRYQREVGLLEPLRATLALAGLAPDASRFRLRNEFLRADGTLAARLDSTGGWLDLVGRRLITPPAEIVASLEALGRTDDFQALPSSLRPRPPGA
jgi:acyl-CoA thioester hydrolase